MEERTSRLEEGTTAQGGAIVVCNRDYSGSIYEDVHVIYTAWTFSSS
jgi:hypothetical protein